MAIIEQLIYEHKDRLYRLCLYLEKNTSDAEDLFQDAWVRALEGYASYDTTKDFWPWLTQIAVNRYRDKLRRLAREYRRRATWDETILHLQADETVQIEQQYVNQEALGSAMQALSSLQDKYKLPLILVVVQKLSYAEVATMLGISEKLVKSRVYDGRQKLKQILEKEAVYERQGARPTVM